MYFLAAEFKCEQSFSKISDTPLKNSKLPLLVVRLMNELIEQLQRSKDQEKPVSSSPCGNQLAGFCTHLAVLDLPERAVVGHSEDARGVG